MADAPTNDPELASFLTGRQPFLVGQASWLGGDIQLAVSAYLSPDLPPRRLVSSVRAVVLRGDTVLVQRSVDGVHILPGGRVEAGEGLEDGLRRDRLEETGWRVEVENVLGFERFHHLTPRPPGYHYPYPDFLWVVYLARAVEHSPEGRLDDGYELGSELCSIEEARALGVRAAELQYLEAADDLEAAAAAAERARSAGSSRRRSDEARARRGDAQCRLRGSTDRERTR